MAADKRHFAFWFFVTLANALVFTGCAPQLANNYRRLRPHLAAHHDKQALSYLDSVKDTVYGANNELLYYMDRAMVQFNGQDHLGCVASLERAKVVAARLWSQSLGQETLAWLSNDNALPYQGEDFEKVFLHLLEALSYARVGNLSDARVEARQVSVRLKALNEKLTGKNITYQDDAFAHYLAGLLYEADGADLSHLSDARIEYERAVHLYETVDGPAYHVAVPPNLVRALGRVLDQLGADGADDLAALTARYGALLKPSKTAKHQYRQKPQARLTIVALVGEAPHKVEEWWALLLGPNLYKVAYPRFLPHNKQPPPRVSIDQGTVFLKPELVMDVQNIAIRNLADHMERIKNRVLAREVAKYTAGTVAQSVGLHQEGLVGLGTFLAGLALNTATAATARADTRSWATLPEAVYIYTCDVAAGPLTLQVGHSAPQTLDLASGESRFIALRTLGE